ncbi:protein zwilch [Topomyia yanbarensis]|uniref:protein zwilch n=1 Tax=Topomyia yanbarensis TaxID=2498891 RepID=UPI00273BBCC3|nr:protein zwilch [Topomyia yanbarensis]
MSTEVTSLANVYAFLKNTYDSVDFLLAPAPTYIQSLAENDSKIIFIYKYDELRSKVMLTDGDEYSSKTSNTSEQNLDLTGSPLKDDVKLENLNLSDEQGIAICLENPWLEREECYAPIPAEKAREILQDVLSSNVSGCGHLWALCDGHDMDKTVLLQVELNGARKFVRGAVTLLGCFPEERISMVKLQRAHETRVQVPTKDLETNIELWFKIQSHISIKLHWISHAEQPSFCINKKSDILLQQRIRVDDTQSVAEYFWSQLHLLDSIKEKILHIRSKNLMTLENELFAGSLDVGLIKEKVHKILTEFCLMESTDYKLTEIGSIVERVKNRTAADVTDRLWSVLKYCSDYDDLKDVLTYIFKAAAKSNLANIPSNNNRLAQLIKSIAQGRLAIPMLTGAEPLELLLEIGLEKILNDYQIIFHESKICNLDLANVGRNEASDGSKSNSRTSSIRKSMYESVQPPTAAKSSQSRKTALLSGTGSTDLEDDGETIQNSYFNANDANSKINKLAQVHLLLEHLLSIETHLKLTSIYSQVAEEYFSRPTICFEEMRSRKTDQLEIAIMNNKIIELVENSTPYIRKVTMTSRGRFRSVQSTFYQSTDPILPTSLFAQLKSENVELKNSYWCLEYTKLANL